MAASLVWINSSNDGLPTLNADDLSRVRSQACRDARKREREQAVLALRKPSQSVHNGAAPSRRIAPRHARSQKIPYGRDATESQGSETDAANETASDSARPLQRLNGDILDSPNPAAGEISPPITVVSPPVQSPAATQQALAAAFIEGHLSRTAYRSFAALGQHVGPVIRRSRSWPAANNALGLLQLNSQSISPHPKLAEEGQRQYGCMLAFLQDELNSASVDLAGVTGTVFHLLLCETYSAIPESATSRQQHLDGMAALVGRMDPLSSSAPLNTFMFKAARMLLLTHALIIRDPGPLQSVACHSDQQTCGTSGLERLLQHAMRVPSLIQAADNAGKSHSGLRSLLPAIQKVLCLELDFETWVAQSPLPKATDSKIPPASMVSVSTSLQTCLTRLERVFGRASAFQSFGIANTHVLYWICILLLRISLLDLIRLATSFEDHAALAAVEDRDLEAEIFACATLLCRSIPFLLQEAGGNVSQAAAIRGPIYFAQLCFERLGSKTKLECVQTVEAEARSHFHSLNWDALLPWSFLALIWQTG